MVAGGEAVRAGEFYRGVRPAEAALSDEPDEAAPDGEAGADLAG
ncbi:hypothetical protein [Methylobacterium sp. WSM2598]|nr:hypothetical protein [Methylobacterium sp. WSM2598]